MPKFDPFPECNVSACGCAACHTAVHALRGAAHRSTHYFCAYHTLRTPWILIYLLHSMKVMRLGPAWPPAPLLLQCHRDRQRLRQLQHSLNLQRKSLASLLRQRQRVAASRALHHSHPAVAM